jgi:anti-sigma B factor antagonist
MPRAGTIASTPSGESHWIVELEGEFDLATAARLRSALDGALAEGASVIVDLTFATFVDSSVIGVLVSAQRSAASIDGRSVSVVAPAGGAPARVLDLMAAGRVLRVFGSRDEALALDLC